VRFVGALPLVVFVLLFSGACLFLDRSHRLLFAAPGVFSLAAFLPWLWWMHVAGFAGLGRVRGQVALQIRLLLAGLFIILLADPRAVRTRDEISVVYALDVSDSIGDGATDTALRFIAETATKKNPRDQAGLIIFGKNAAVEFPARTSVPLEASNVILNSLIDKEATNLEQGLSLAAAIIPEDTQGRIVLISDGTQTEGNLARIIDDLKAKGISVDVIPIQYNFEEEVWLERLELPQFVKLGENYEAGIVLSSLSAGEGMLRIEENGKVVAEQPVKFQAGKNRYTFPIYLRTAGYYEYTATIEVPRGKDSIDKNNKVINSLFLEGEGKVLVVTDPHGEARDWQPLAAALREGKHAVEIRNAYDFPRDSSSLLPYDCIIFVNAPADAFDSVQLQAARDAVYNFGSGFLMVGGANSFGPGGYHRTVVEDALPVTMDVSQKKVLPKGALVIILHTCEFPEGNTWAKRITKQAIKVLGAQDEVGVLIYGPQGGEQWVFKLTPAGEYEKLVPKINAAEPGDMPTFATTMQMGLTELKKSDAATKHMIIISDGDPVPAPPPVVQGYIDNQISVSTVAIFPHGGTEIGLLRNIATATGGALLLSGGCQPAPGDLHQGIEDAETEHDPEQDSYPRSGNGRSKRLARSRRHSIAQGVCDHDDSAAPRHDGAAGSLRTKRRRGRHRPDSGDLALRVGSDGRLYIRSGSQLGRRMDELGQIRRLRAAADHAHLPRPQGRSPADVDPHLRQRRCDRRRGFSRAGTVSGNSGARHRSPRPGRNGSAQTGRTAAVPGVGPALEQGAVSRRGGAGRRRSHRGTRLRRVHRPLFPGVSSLPIQSTRPAADRRKNRRSGAQPGFHRRRHLRNQPAAQAELTADL
jgi:hypothetical protein